MPSRNFRHSDDCKSLTKHMGDQQFNFDFNFLKIRLLSFKFEILYFKRQFSHKFFRKFLDVHFFLFPCHDASEFCVVHKRFKSKSPETGLRSINYQASNDVQNTNVQIGCSSCCECCYNYTHLVGGDLFF